MSRVIPSWDTTFMEMAFIISKRSKDPHTRHGSCLINTYNQVTGMGYNGPPQGIDDTLVPTDREAKRPFYLHAEENLLLFSPQNIEGFTVYVTGRPCPQCTRMLIQKRVGRVVYGPIESKCVDQNAIDACELMIKWSGIKFEQYQENLSIIQSSLGAHNE